MSNPGNSPDVKPNTKALMPQNTQAQGVPLKPKTGQGNLDFQVFPPVYASPLGENKKIVAPKKPLTEEARAALVAARLQDIGLMDGPGLP